ncbi:tellurite resistance TerB C-terminal domain-containing protein, partial [Acinetobacter baumannii]
GTKPTATTVAKIEETGFKLDPARIAALQKDTEAVSALLSGIFKEENQPEPVLVETEPEDDAEAPSPGLLGLDEAHSALARLLLSRPE